MNGMKTEMPDSFYYAFYMNLWKMTNMVRYARDCGFYNYLSDEERADIDEAIDDAQRTLDTYKKKQHTRARTRRTIHTTQQKESHTMPTNYEVLRSYAEAKTHFLDQRTEAGLPNGNEEQFFNWLHDEYVPPKPKPLTIPQRRAVDIAHAIFTQCVVQEDWNRTLSVSAIKALPGWRNYCEAQWLDPDCYSTIWQAIQLLRDAGLVNIIGATKNRMYQFVNTEDDEAYRLLAETVRKDRTEAKENVA